LRVIFAVVCIALLGSCSPNLPLLDQIRLLGELRVVTRNAPTTFYYGATERYGIEYELTKAFADYLGVRLSLRTVDQIDEIFPEIAGRRAHIAAAGLTITESRRDVVAFSPSYQDVTAQLIYRMGRKRPASISDVAGNIIEVRAGSSHVDTLNQALKQVPGLAWAENRSTGAEALMKRVADGTIDYAVVNSNEFALLRNYYPEVRVAFDLQSGGSLGWALPLYAPDLQEEVSAFFARIEATGTSG